MGLKFGDISPLAGAVTGKGLTANAGRNGAIDLAVKLASSDKNKDGKKAAPVAGGKPAMRKGGKVSSYAKGGSVTRGDGCVSKGRTKGRMV